MDALNPSLGVTLGRDPDGTPVVVLAGQLDLATADRAEDVFAGLAAETSPDRDRAAVVVDMSELTFMDSTGLRVLLRAAHRGHALRLRRPTRIIRRLIAVTGLDTTLPVEP
jgi:anti-sigma B factor antagonist